MSSIGSDVRVGKLKVLESISFDDGTMLTATNVYIQDKLTLGPNIVVQGLDETYCTDAELAAVAIELPCSRTTSRRARTTRLGPPTQPPDMRARQATPRPPLCRAITQPLVQMRPL